MSASDADCRVEKQPSRLAHNQENAGASPAPATTSEPVGLAASPSVDCAPAASRGGWIKVDDETFLMLRLLADERGVGVPALVGELARKEFPMWARDEAADRPREAEGPTHD